MGVDIAKARARAEEELAKSKANANRSASYSIKYWKPKAGQNRIRLMPPWTEDPNNPNAKQFWREIYIHWSIGEDENNKKSFACPVKTPVSPGGDCPICQHVDKLRATKSAIDAEQAKELRAKQQLYSNMVDLDDPVYEESDVTEWQESQNDKTRECPFEAGEPKVQAWMYGPTIFKELLDIFTDNVDITDINKGHNLTLTREGKERNTRYRLRIDPVASKFDTQGVDIATKLIDLDLLKPFEEAVVMLQALNGMTDGGTARPPLPKPIISGQLGPKMPSPPKQHAVVDFPLADSLPDEEPPVCFKDVNVHSETDPECVGGSKDGVSYDKCPYFAPCHTAVVAALNPPKPSRRSGKTAAPSMSSKNQSVDELEAQMRNALLGK